MAKKYNLEKKSEKNLLFGIPSKWKKVKKIYIILTENWLMLFLRGHLSVK